MPSPPVPISSSFSARIIPSEATPRSFAFFSLVPSGITAPGFATATVCPAQPVGVGVRLHVEHVAHDEALAAAHAVVVDRLDLRAGQRQALLDLVHVER